MPATITSIVLTKRKIDLVRDLPGFPGARHFSLEPLNEGDSIFARLRCTDTVRMTTGLGIDNLVLMVVSPGAIWPDYSVSIDDATAKLLGLANADDALLLAVVHLRVPLTKSTVNLYSPIVVNLTTGQADQIVPSATEKELGWSVRTEFPSQIGN